MTTEIKIRCFPKIKAIFNENEVLSFFIIIFNLKIFLKYFKTSNCNKKHSSIK